MVKLEVGKAYMTGTKHVALVYKNNPDQFPAGSKYSKHACCAMLFRIATPVSCMETFTEEGMYALEPTSADVVREATLEELYKYISQNASELYGAKNECLEIFYKVWKEKNP